MKNILRLYFTKRYITMMAIGALAALGWAFYIEYTTLEEMSFGMYDRPLGFILIGAFSIFPNKVMFQEKRFHMLPVSKSTKFMALNSVILLTIVGFILFIGLGESLLSILVGNPFAPFGILTMIDDHFLDLLLPVWSLSILGSVLFRNSTLALVISTVLFCFIIYLVRNYQLDQGYTLLINLASFIVFYLDYYLFKQGQVANNGILKI